jgi:hypothetical protein
VGRACPAARGVGLGWRLAAGLAGRWAGARSGRRGSETPGRAGAEGLGGERVPPAEGQSRRCPSRVWKGRGAWPEESGSRLRFLAARGGARWLSRLGGRQACVAPPQGVGISVLLWARAGESSFNAFVPVNTGVERDPNVMDVPPGFPPLGTARELGSWEVSSERHTHSLSLNFIEFGHTSQILLSDDCRDSMLLAFLLPACLLVISLLSSTSPKKGGGEETSQPGSLLSNHLKGFLGGERVLRVYRSDVPRRFGELFCCHSRWTLLFFS